MDILKNLFPFSFKEKSTVAALVINVIIYVVVGAVVGVLIALLANLPIVGIVIRAVGGLIDLYVTVGIVLSFLDYFKVIK